MIYGIIIGCSMMIAFSIGVNIGITVSNRSKVELNPVKVVKENIKELKEDSEQDKATKEIMEGLNNIINY